MRRWLLAFFPFLAWTQSVRRDMFRPDLEAGFIGAVLILPQAIALATLAGMPPEYGIYTSIFPVIIAALWGSSWHALAGPNTAVCVLIAYSIAPLAAEGSGAYIGYALALTLMVGVIQLLIGVLRLGTVLDFISHTVIAAIVLAVGLVIMVSAASPFIGVAGATGQPLYLQLSHWVTSLPEANVYAVAVGTLTVTAGFLARLWWRRYALVIAVVAGSVFAFALDSYLGHETTRLAMVGALDLSWLPLSLPTFDLGSLEVFKKLLVSAFAIAFLGLMQSIVIARSLAVRSAQQIDTNQEIIGQGLANMAAPFISSFAGSGSFNRSAAHYDAGARTPLAAVYASLLLAVIVLAGAPLIAHMPLAAVAGALVLVGYGLIDLQEAGSLMRSRHERLVFVATLAVALTMGLSAAVFSGVALSLIIYLWHASTPNVVIEEHIARDGRPVSVVTIDGNLFFGSVRYVERGLRYVGAGEDEPRILLLRTDHLTYLDVSGSRMLAQEARRRRALGDEVLLYAIRAKVIDVLKEAESLNDFGSENIIYRDRHHPMKELLYPAQARTAPGDGGDNHSSHPSAEQLTMQQLAKRLRATTQFSHLTTEQIEHLLESAGERKAPAGETLIDPQEAMNCHLVLLAGEAEVERIWMSPEGVEKRHATVLGRDRAAGGFELLAASSGRVQVRALTEVRFIPIDADEMDAMLGWSQLDDRLVLARHLKLFHNIPLENVQLAFERMQEREVEAGDTVVTQGEPGDSYYIILSGEAEVWRTDPFTEETASVALLRDGDGFGEEALLQGGYRNATVKMNTPGKLLSLSKEDFAELLQPVMVDEVDASTAQDRLAAGAVRLLDCRYDMEFEESRIPGARLVPLDKIREGVYALDPDADYIVYCRSGRRSKAAAFLLNERGIKAASLAGGIKDWPYDVDTQPVNHEAS